MIKPISDKLAFGGTLTLLEAFELKAWHESPEAASPEGVALMGGEAGYTLACGIVIEHGKGLTLQRLKDYKSTGKVGVNRIERMPGEKMADAVSRCLPVLIGEGMTEPQAVAVAFEMCEKATSAKGPKEFAAWVADQGDAVEAAWIDGQKVYVSTRPDFEDEDNQDIVVELEALLGEGLVTVETSEAPPEGEGWEQVKEHETDEDKAKRWESKHMYEDELTPLGRFMFHWGGDHKDIELTGRVGGGSVVPQQFAKGLSQMMGLKVDASQDIRDEEPDAPIVKLAEQLAGIFAEQEAAVLSEIRKESAKGYREIGADGTPLATKAPEGTEPTEAPEQGLEARIRALLASFDKAIEDAIQPFVDRMIGQGGDAGADRINTQIDGLDFDFDVTNPEVDKFLKDYAIRLADSVQQRSAEAINVQLRAGLAAGETFTQMAERVEATGRFSTAQAERIARTESARAYVQGQEEAWKQSEVVKGKRWLLAPGACPTCRALAGKFNEKRSGLALGDAAYKVGESFQTADGQTINVTYADIVGPPGHPNCRCDTIAVL